jgi:hypothetical protein
MYRLAAGVQGGFKGLADTAAEDGENPNRTGGSQ